MQGCLLSTRHRTAPTLHPHCTALHLTAPTLHCTALHRTAPSLHPHCTLTAPHCTHTAPTPHHTASSCIHATSPRITLHPQERDAALQPRRLRVGTERPRRHRHAGERCSVLQSRRLQCWPCVCVSWAVHKPPLWELRHWGRGWGRGCGGEGAGQRCCAAAAVLLCCCCCCATAGCSQQDESPRLNHGFLLPSSACGARSWGQMRAP